MNIVSSITRCYCNSIKQAYPVATKTPPLREGCFCITGDLLGVSPLRPQSLRIQFRSCYGKERIKNRS